MRRRVGVEGDVVGRPREEGGVRNKREKEEGRVRRGERRGKKKRPILFDLSNPVQFDSAGPIQDTQN